MSDVNDRASLPARVVDTVRSVIGQGPEALHQPRFAGNEWTYLKECLDSTFVSSVGKFVDRFEKELADFTGARHVVAVVNGTAALQVALRLAGVQAGEEVLVPALTFVATVTAVIYCGGMPHFVDSEERSLGLDPRALREYLRRCTEMRGGQCVNRSTGKVIRALVPMHTFGHPVDIDGVLAVARDHGLVLVEDAAESLGSMVGGRHTG
ncbi:MAG: aminotransferase class I/II-fold pyridoxal phosphate-dependent enzyme, partial [Chloroflexota bacterium]